MICSLEWNKLCQNDWKKRYQKVRRANLLQSCAYAKAVCALNHQKARGGLIKIDGRDAGLVQVIEAGFLRNAVHGVILDRGPLWFEGFGTPEHIRLFWAAFNKDFPRRFGRRCRLIPEMPETAQSKELLEAFGYKRRAEAPYQTIWMDLDKDPGVLRTAMKSNWRNKLGKAEKAGLRIEWDEGGKYFPWLLKIYTLDKAKRGYDGPSPELLTALSKTFAPEKNMLIGRALLDERAVAAILVLCHGTSATWQVGWTSDEGRKAAAHHLLLWETFRVLKERGIHDFDLGGVNDEAAAGVKTFKEGLGGKLVRLAGLYT